PAIGGDGRVGDVDPAVGGGDVRLVLQRKLGPEGGPGEDYVFAVRRDGEGRLHDELGQERVAPGALRRLERRERGEVRGGSFADDVGVAARVHRDAVTVIRTGPAEIRGLHQRGAVAVEFRDERVKAAGVGRAQEAGGVRGREVVGGARSEADD